MSQPNDVRATLEAMMAQLESARQARAKADLNVRQAQTAFGYAVRLLRAKRGISLSEVARRANMSKAMLHDFELGRRWSDTLAEQMPALLDAALPKQRKARRG